jgi:diguanylate cyclase (GGDEF)-like protein
MDKAEKQTLHEILRQQVRPLILFCAAMLIVLAAGVIVGARTLMGSYLQLETSATRQKAEQVYRAFEADLRQLQMSNRDYAEWDAAEDYIRSRDPVFLASNFSAEELAGMHVDTVWIVDANGRDVFSRSVDRGLDITTPAPRELLDALRRFAVRDPALRERSPAERLVRTPLGLAAVSALEITRSNKSRPSGATMLFARLIEDDELDRVRETSQLPVTLIDLGPGDAQKLPAEVAAWARAAQAAPFFVRPADERVVVGYSLLRDVDGAPLAAFATESAREIRALGMRTSWYVLSIVVGLFVAFGTIASVLLLRVVALNKRHALARRDAEEQRRSTRRKLAKQALRDPLTGLPNRLYLHTRLPRLIAKMADSNRLLAVVCLDIDHFKNINETRGHAQGDRLLQIVAKRLRANVSTADIVARMGGDDFVIVASLLADEKAVQRFAKRLQAIVGADVNLSDKVVTVTASLGLALYPRDGADMETLLKRAEIALYQAKEAGRRCYRFFAEDMSARVNQHAALEQELRRAIDTPQVYLEYQPIIDLRDGRVVSLEALMRWRHPEVGSIPPARFIPVAEKSGLILELGQQALKDVLKQQRAWLDEDVPVVPIAVNVSALQVDRLDFAAQVKRLTTEAGVEPKWVRFEITESAVTKEPERLIATLRELRSLGSQVLIDDFGTGYSSLSYLSRLPADILKIDRAFVRDLGRSEEHSPIIRAIIDMAKRLNMKTVAEGVETPMQAAVLCELECDYAQGFLYSKPVAAHHCRVLLEQLRRERPLTETMIMRVVGT